MISSRIIALALAIAVWNNPAPAAAQSTREVTVTSRSVVTIDAKVRFTTMVILPEGEEILDIICGDKDFWIVSGVHNFAYIKPAKAGAATNMNLVTKSGTVYSFLLTEGAATPDLKVFVLPDSSLQRSVPQRRWYSDEDMEQVRREAQDVRRESETARQRAEAARESSLRAAEDELVRLRATYPTQLQFPYRFKANAKPFRVSAMYHDGRATYIRLASTELPAVYELKDRAASVVNVQVQNGTLVVPKVLDSGYLALGKQRFFFDMRAK